MGEGEEHQRSPGTPPSWHLITLGALRTLNSADFYGGFIIWVWLTKSLISSPHPHRRGWA